ncbi:MAG: hypothetical protein QM767_01880 [Anaeromyxobacter sp.]
MLITSEKEHTLPFGDVYKINVATGTYGPNLTIDDSFLHIGGGGDPTWSPGWDEDRLLQSRRRSFAIGRAAKGVRDERRRLGKKKIDCRRASSTSIRTSETLPTATRTANPTTSTSTTPPTSTQAMEQDEVRVRNFLGDLTILDSQVGRRPTAGQGVCAIAQLQQLLTAWAWRLRGTSTTTTPSELGRPDILLYAPKRRPRRDRCLPRLPLHARFVGLRHRLRPGEDPTFAGFPADAWLVHEAGFHHILGGTFEPTPPANDVPQGVEGHPHAARSRFSRSPGTSGIWDIHFFVNPNGGTAQGLASSTRSAGDLPGFSGASSVLLPADPVTRQTDLRRSSKPRTSIWPRISAGRTTTAGNGGGQYRVTDVDISKSLDSGDRFDVRRPGNRRRVFAYSVNARLDRHP